MDVQSMPHIPSATGISWSSKQNWERQEVVQMYEGCRGGFQFIYDWGVFLAQFVLSICNNKPVESPKWSTRVCVITVEETFSHKEHEIAGFEKVKQYANAIIPGLTGLKIGTVESIKSMTVKTTYTDLIPVKCEVTKEFYEGEQGPVADGYIVNTSSVKKPILSKRIQEGVIITPAMNDAQIETIVKAALFAMRVPEGKRYDDGLKIAHKLIERFTRVDGDKRALSQFGVVTVRAKPSQKGDLLGAWPSERAAIEFLVGDLRGDLIPNLDGWGTLFRVPEVKERIEWIRKVSDGHYWSQSTSAVSADKVLHNVFRLEVDV